MKIKNLIFLTLIIFIILSLPIVFSDIIETLLEFGSGINIELGSGVNITEGTIIRLNGLNCNLTVVGNHIVDNMDVYPNYLLLGTSLRNLTYILNLSYNYLPEIKTLNITCSQLNTETYLSADISFLNGIKLYRVSEPSNLTSVDWSSSTQNFSFIVNAPSGTTSTINVYWPFSTQPDIIECTASPCNSNWNPVTHILTLTATHSSEIKWTLHSQTILTTTTTTTTTIPDTEQPRWGPIFDHVPSSPTFGQNVTINVDWSDNNDLTTVIISENATDNQWTNHTCDMATHTCSEGGLLMADLSINLTGISTGVLMFTGYLVFIVKKTKTWFKSHKFKILSIYIAIIACIILLSISLSPEMSRNVRNILARLGIGIFPTAIGPITFSHKITTDQLSSGEIVGYMSYARDPSGNWNKTQTRSFIVQAATATTTTSTTTTTINSINHIEVNGTTFVKSETINITGWSGNVSSYTYLWNDYNGTLQSMLSTGTGVQSNITSSSNLNVGLYNVSCNSTWNSTLSIKSFNVVTTTTTTTTTVIGDEDNGDDNGGSATTTTTVLNTTTSILTTTPSITTVPDEEGSPTNVTTTTTVPEEKPKGIKTWYVIPIVIVFVTIAVAIWYLKFMKKPAEQVAFDQLKEKWSN